MFLKNLLGIFFILIQLVVQWVMKLILSHQVIKVVNQDVYVYGIISMELDKVHYKFNKNLKSVERKHYGQNQMIKVQH